MRRPPNPVTKRLVRAMSVRLRTLRQAHRLRLGELARAAEIPPSTLSRIEQGRRPGTPRHYLKLAAALGMTLAELFAGLEDEVDGITATTAWAPLRRHRLVVSHESTQASIRYLTSPALRKRLIPVLLDVPPGGTYVEKVSLGTERFLYMLTGALELRMGTVRSLLTPGDSLHLTVPVAHRLTNRGTHPARCLTILTRPAGS